MVADFVRGSTSCPITSTQGIRANISWFLQILCLNPRNFLRSRLRRSRMSYFIVRVGAVKNKQFVRASFGRVFKYAIAQAFLRRKCKSGCGVSSLVPPHPYSDLGEATKRYLYAELFVSHIESWSISARAFGAHRRFLPWWEAREKNMRLCVRHFGRLWFEMVAASPNMGEREQPKQRYLALMPWALTVPRLLYFSKISNTKM